MKRIYLDDIRTPLMSAGYMPENVKDDYLKDWIIVRNYDDFVKEINNNYPNISHISFDHDLGDDIAQFEFKNGLYSKRQARKRKKDVKSGYDCAKWLDEFYRDRKHKLPIIYIHSQNQVGGENIKALLSNNKFREYVSEEGNKS